MAEHIADTDARGPIDNVGRAILETIRNYGVDTVFGIPGTHNLEFYRHLADLGLRAVTNRHEQGAGHGAAGWALRTRLPGVVVTTSGPGLLNVLSAAATSFCEARPMLILAPGAPGGEFRDVGALHETKDQLAAAEAVVGRAVRADSGARAVAAVHEAFALFAAPRPRPVYIEVPLDVLEGPADVPAAERVARPVARVQPADADGERDADGDVGAVDPAQSADVDADAVSPGTPGNGSAVGSGAGANAGAVGPETAAAIGRAAAVLATASAPIIVAGSGALPARASLLELAEALDAPVVTSVNARGAIPESHPLALGAGFRFAAANELVNGCDAVLIAGSKVGQTELWAGPLAPTGTVIRIDALESQLSKNVEPDLPIVADTRHALPALLSALRAFPPRAGASPEAAVHESGECESGVQRAARAREAFTAEAVAGDPESVALARALAPVLPAGTIVAADSSQASYNGTANFVPVEQPNEYIYMPSYATLGFGLPAAIGAAIASPDRAVVCVLGDGALMFAVQEFATAVEQGVDLVVVVADNGGYREIEENEAAVGIPPTAVRLAQPDWPGLATAFGAHGVAAESREDVPGAVGHALAVGGVWLVHVPMEIFKANDV